jgi:hypothetical protein
LKDRDCVLVIPFVPITIPQQQPTIAPFTVPPAMDAS